MDASSRSPRAPAGRRGRWLSRQAVVLHLSLLLWVPGCIFAFWWQVNRAFDGNGLSYLYSIEWPIFALVGVYAWWSLIHTDPDSVGRRAQEKLTTGTPVPATAAAVRRREEEDPELAAYNDHLAALAEKGPKTWRRS